MANLVVKDGSGNSVYIKATGAGTDNDPLILDRTDATTAALIGAVTETAPATDTASSGLNGRLQRIAQRITSLIALIPAALGAGGGIKVDGSGTALPISAASLPSHPVTNAGTFATQATLQAGTNAVGSVKDNGAAFYGTNTYTTSADMSTAADIAPAPTSGQKSILHQCSISVGVAMEFTLQIETTPAAERHSFLLPANGTVIFIPRYPIKLGTADKKWQGKASVAGQVRISTVTTSEA